MTPSAQKWFLIANPRAGGGKAASRIDTIRSSLDGLGFAIEEAHTKHPGHAVTIARQARDDGWENFMVLGGDGTAYETINGLLGDGKRPPIRLAMFPAGTGNSFLRDFTKNGLDHTLKCLSNKKSRPCDVLHLSHESGELVFMNLLSFGFVADVASTTNRKFKKLGELGYVAGVLANLIDLKPLPLHLRMDDEEIRGFCTFVSINNSRFTGGKMMMAPDADSGDGLADVIMVDAISRLRLLRTFPQIFSGKHISRPFVRTKKARKISFNFEASLDLMIDGEVAHLKPNEINVIPNAMEIFA